MTVAPAIDWVTVENAIQAWVAAAASPYMPATSVVWADLGAANVRPMIAISWFQVGEIAHDGVDIAENVITVDPFAVTFDYTTGLLHAPAHGRTTGDGPLQLVVSMGGVAPGLLVANGQYWVIAPDADHLQLAASFTDTGGNFVGNPTTPIAFTDDGTGTFQLEGTAHTVAAGAEVVQTSFGQREMTVELQAFGDTNTGRSAVQILVDVIASLALYVDALNDSGVGVTDIGNAYLAGGIRLVQGRRGSILEPRAICDMTVYLETSLSNTIGCAEHLSLAVLVSDEAGNQIDEIDITADAPAE